MSADDWTDAEVAAWHEMLAEVRADEEALLAKARAEQPDAGWVPDHALSVTQRCEWEMATLGSLFCEVPSSGGPIRMWATRPRWVETAAALWVVRLGWERDAPEHRAATLPEATAAAVAAERARREALARAWLGGAP